MKTRKLTLTALMTAVALGIFVAEAQIPFMPSIPGIKLGLANVVTVFAMYLLGPGATACIVLVRVTLGCFATGQLMAFLYSMAGGLLALCISTVLSHFFPVNRMWVVSVIRRNRPQYRAACHCGGHHGNPGNRLLFTSACAFRNDNRSVYRILRSVHVQRLSNNFQKYI